MGAWEVFCIVLFTLYFLGEGSRRKGSGSGCGCLSLLLLLLLLAMFEGCLG